MTDAQSYIITSLDLVTEELENYLFSGAQIFNLRMVEDSNAELRTLLNDWSYLAERTGKVNIPAPKFLKVCSCTTAVLLTLLLCWCTC